MASLPRDPDQLKAHSQAQLGKFLAWLFAAIVDMDEFDQSLTEEQRPLAQTVKDDLRALNERAKFLTVTHMEMSDAILLLLQQHQSAKKAFNLGWDSFYRELIMRLSPEQRKEIDEVLDSIMGNDIPF